MRPWGRVSLRNMLSSRATQLLDFSTMIFLRLLLLHFSRRPIWLSHPILSLCPRPGIYLIPVKLFHFRKLIVVPKLSFTRLNYWGSQSYLKNVKTWFSFQAKHCHSRWRAAGSGDRAGARVCVTPRQGWQYLNCVCICHKFFWSLLSNFVRELTNLIFFRPSYDNRGRYRTKIWRTYLYYDLLPPLVYLLLYSRKYLQVFFLFNFKYQIKLILQKLSKDCYPRFSKLFLYYYSAP